MTSSGGGAVLAVPEVVASRNMTVERGAVLSARRVAAGALLSLDTVDQTATMEVAANASSAVAIAGLVTGVTVTGDVRSLSVDEAGDNAALTTDVAVVTCRASEVDIAVNGSNVSVVILTLNGSLAAVVEVSVAVKTGNTPSHVSVETVVAVTRPFAGLRVDAQPDYTSIHPSPNSPGTSP